MTTVFNNERWYACGSDVGQQDVYKTHIFFPSTTKDNDYSGHNPKQCHLITISRSVMPRIGDCPLHWEC